MAAAAERVTKAAMLQAEPAAPLWQAARIHQRIRLKAATNRPAAMARAVRPDSAGKPALHRAALQALAAELPAAALAVAATPPAERQPTRMPAVKPQPSRW